MAVVITEDPDLIPLCPYCNSQLNEVVASTPAVRGSVAFKFGKRTVYACPSCRKALGISQRKGFWAG